MLPELECRSLRHRGPAAWTVAPVLSERAAAMRARPRDSRGHRLPYLGQCGVLDSGLVEPLLELLHRLPERPREFRKSLGPEEEQDQHEPDEQILIAHHGWDPQQR